MMEMMELKISFESGKYTISQRGCGAVRLLRHGEEWVKDARPAGLWIAVAYEVHCLRRLAAAGVALREGRLSPEAFDVLRAELCGLADVERDLLDPGMV